MRLTSLALAAGLAAAAGPAGAGNHGQLTAHMHNTDGESVGTVALRQTPHGTLVDAELNGLPEGAHAFHIHDTGACEPDFAAAGGHFNPGGVGHGIEDADGAHAGDMPNIHVPASGALHVELLNARLAVDERLLDEDGAAVVIHEGPDDYETDPAGAAGQRIACGVIEEG